jgi:tRNA A-37 threonylcarbamoyl transferase component Bud32
MVTVAKYNRQLEQLGLDTLATVKQFEGELVKNHRGRRDIFKISTTDDEERPLGLFLKRNLKPYKKDGLASLVLRGKVCSQSRREWENSVRLQDAGLQTCGLVAYGEERGLLWEKFSFLITEAAPGERLDQFFRCCHDARIRASVITALAHTIRRMHDAGLASPDLFTKHIFVDTSLDVPKFSFIDMARLDRCKKISDALRARDLASLNLTAPLENVSPKERIRFLKAYAGCMDRNFVSKIASEVKRLLKKSKFRRIYKFDTGGGSFL